MYERPSERASERKRVCVRTRTDAASRSLLGASHLARSKAPPTLPCPAPAPLFLCLSVPLSVCTRPWRACLERVFHFGWFGWSRSAASTSAGAVQRASARQAFAFLHPSFLPSSTSPPVRAPLFGESVFQPLAAATPLPPPTAACNGRTVADSNAVAATLTGRQVSLALQYGALNPTI